jgi:hypothetical protein
MKKHFVMKRIKIMMFSFALLAVTGGALAFKAKLWCFDVCYTTTLNAPIPSCPDLTVGYTNIVPPEAIPIIIYTTDKVVTLGATPAQCQFKDANQSPLIECTISVSVTSCAVPR